MKIHNITLIISSILIILLITSPPVIIGITPYVDELNWNKTEVSKNDSAQLEQQKDTYKMDVGEPANNYLENITKITDEFLYNVTNVLSILASLTVSNDYVLMDENGDILIVTDSNAPRYGGHMKFNVKISLTFTNDLIDLIKNGDVKLVKISITTPKIDNNNKPSWVIHESINPQDDIKWKLHIKEVARYDPVTINSVQFPAEKEVTVYDVNAYHIVNVYYEVKQDSLDSAVDQLFNNPDNFDQNQVKQQKVILIKPSLTPNLEDIPEDQLVNEILYSEDVSLGTPGQEKTASEPFTSEFKDLVKTVLETLLTSNNIVLQYKGNTIDLGTIEDVILQSELISNDCSGTNTVPSPFNGLSRDELYNELYNYMFGSISDVYLKSNLIYDYAVIEVTATLSVSVRYDLSDSNSKFVDISLNTDSSYASTSLTGNKLGGYTLGDAIQNSNLGNNVNNIIDSFSKNYLSVTTTVKDIKSLNEPNKADTINYKYYSYPELRNTNPDYMKVFQQFWEGVQLKSYTSDLARVYGVKLEDNTQGNTGVEVSTVKLDKLNYGISSGTGYSSFIFNVWDYISSTGERLYESIMNAKLKIDKNSVLKIFVKYNSGNSNTVTKLSGSMEKCFVYNDGSVDSLVKVSIDVDAEAKSYVNERQGEYTSNAVSYTDLVNTLLNNINTGTTGSAVEGSITGFTISLGKRQVKQLVLNINLDAEVESGSGDSAYKPGPSGYLLIPGIAPKGAGGVYTKVSSLLDSLGQLIASQTGSNPQTDITSAFNQMQSSLTIFGFDLSPFPTYIPIPLTTVNGPNIGNGQLSITSSGAYVMPGEYLGAILLTDEYKHSPLYSSIYAVLDPFFTGVVSLYIEAVTISIDGGYLESDSSKNTVALFSIAIGIGPDDADYTFGRRLYIVPGTSIVDTGSNSNSNNNNDALSKLMDLLGKAGIINQNTFNTISAKIKGAYIQLTPYVFNTEPNLKTIWPYVMFTTKTNERFVVDPDSDKVTIKVSSHIGIYIHIMVGKLAIIPLIDLYIMTDGPSVELKVAKIAPIPLFYAIEYPQHATVRDLSLDDILRESNLIIYSVPVWMSDTSGTGTNTQQQPLLLSPVLLRGDYVIKDSNNNVVGRSSLVITLVDENNNVLDYVTLTDVGISLDPLKISLAEILDKLKDKDTYKLYLKMGWMQGYQLTVDEDITKKYTLEFRKVEVKIITMTSEYKYITYTLVTDTGYDIASSKVVGELKTALDLTATLSDIADDITNQAINVMNQVPLKLEQTAREIVIVNVNNQVQQLIQNMLKVILYQIGLSIVAVLIAAIASFLLPIPGVDELIAEVIEKILNKIANPQDLKEKIQDIVVNLVVASLLYFSAKLVELVIESMSDDIREFVQNRILGPVNSAASQIQQYASDALNIITLIEGLAVEGKPLAVATRTHMHSTTTGLIDNIFGVTGEQRYSMAIDIVELDNTEDGALILYTPLGVGHLLQNVLGNRIPGNLVIMPSNILAIAASWIAFTGGLLNMLYNIKYNLGSTNNNYDSTALTLQQLYESLVNTANDIHNVIAAANGKYAYLGLVDAGMNVASTIDSTTLSSTIIVGDIVYLPPTTLS